MQDSLCIVSHWSSKGPQSPVAAQDLKNNQETLFMVRLQKAGEGSGQTYSEALYSTPAVPRTFCVTVGHLPPGAQWIAFLDIDLSQQFPHQDMLCLPLAFLCPLASAMQIDELVTVFIPIPCRILEQWPQRRSLVPFPNSTVNSSMANKRCSCLTVSVCEEPWGAEKFNSPHEVR